MDKMQKLDEILKTYEEEMTETLRGLLTMTSRLSVKTSMISSLPASKSGSMPMPRSAFFSAVGLIAPSFAPLRQSF